MLGRADRWTYDLIRQISTAIGENMIVGSLAASPWGWPFDDVDIIVEDWNDEIAVMNLISCFHLLPRSFYDKYIHRMEGFRAFIWKNGRLMAREHSVELAKLDFNYVAPAEGVPIFKRDFVVYGTFLNSDFIEVPPDSELLIGQGTNIDLLKKVNLILGYIKKHNVHYVLRGLMIRISQRERTLMPFKSIRLDIDSAIELLRPKRHPYLHKPGESRSGPQ